MTRIIYIGQREKTKVSSVKLLTCWGFVGFSEWAESYRSRKALIYQGFFLYTLQYSIFSVCSQVLFHVVIYHAVSWESNPLFARVFTIFRVCIGLYRDVVFYCIIFHNQLGFWWVRWVFDGDTQKDSTERNYSRYPMYIFLVILVTIRFLLHYVTLSYDIKQYTRRKGDHAVGHPLVTLVTYLVTVESAERVVIVWS